MKETVLVTRENKKEDTAVTAGDFTVGAGNFSFIAGPCSVDRYEVTLEIAKKVKAAGASLFRGGAFKPRTSPYAFQGLREEGIEILAAAGRDAGIPVVSEITDPRQLELFEKIDVLQVGARNSKNYELLREIGKTQKPVILKRGMCDTVDEILQSAEYIAFGGNMNIILCERGIRTFVTSLRNTLDIGGMIMLKDKTHLPVIADPSHAAGIAQPVYRLSLAAAAAGADGLMLEVHTDPRLSLSDPEQAIDTVMFEKLVKSITSLRKSL